MKTTWGRKHALAEDAGPLRGLARERLRAVSTPDLVIWIDNSLAKIGKLVSDGQRGGADPVLVRQAETEAMALVQALRELAGRNDRM